MVDTTDEWIMTTDRYQGTSYSERGRTGNFRHGSRSGKGLLAKDRHFSLRKSDLLICATVTPDMIFPATANIISDKAGIKNAFSFDINAACSGLLFALITASKYIETGTYKKVIVVGADKMSSITDYTNRETCVLFGDGAGAILLEPTTEEVGIMDSILRYRRFRTHHLHMKAGGSIKPPSTRNGGCKRTFHLPGRTAGL